MYLIGESIRLSKGSSEIPTWCIGTWRWSTYVTGDSCSVTNQCAKRKLRVFDDDATSRSIRVSSSTIYFSENFTNDHDSYLHRYQKHLGLPVSTEMNANHRSTRNNESSVISSSLNSANQRAATIVGGHSQVPEFHTSIPASFEISRPNFYTELNPSASDQPTSNFAHTANIDEDYDT